MLDLVVGVAAIGVIELVKRAEHATTRWSAGVRAVAVGATLAVFYALGRGLTGEPNAIPLTGVVFVAEYTGKATVIVPALIAMAATRLVVGDRSVSPAQRP